MYNRLIFVRQKILIVFVIVIMNCVLLISVVNLDNYVDIWLYCLEFKHQINAFYSGN